jgi:hypothetical protein
MIFLRITNWLLVNAPFICLFIFQERKNKEKDKVNVSWTIILLMLLAISTNWNTLCWDSWNRLLWFLILSFLTLKEGSSQKPNHFNAVFLSIFTLIAIGIKTPNMLVIPLTVAYLFTKKEQPIRTRLFGIFVYLLCCIVLISLVYFNHDRVLKIFHLGQFISEVSNTTHNFYFLLLNNLEQISIYLLLRMAICFFKMKSIYNNLMNFVIFCTTILIGYNFINIPNSGLAFLVLFLYFEFLYFVYGLNIKGLKTNIIWFAIIPLLYSAGSDLSLYKAYWIVPQSFALLLVLHGDKILSRLDIDLSITKYALVLLIILSINNQLFGNLYKSSRLVFSTKSVDQEPFNHLKIDYYQKKLINDQIMNIRKYWDEDTSNINIVLGAQSFIFSNHLEFGGKNNKDEFSKNYYLFKSIHAGILDSSGIIDYMRIIKGLKNKKKKPTRIFNFVKYHEIPNKAIFSRDTIEILYDSEGLQILKINSDNK